MIESVIVGLIVALIGAITFIAYKHPNAYERMSIQAITFIGMTAFMICVWQLGAVSSSASTIAQLASSKDAATLSVISDNAISLVRYLKWLGITIVTVAIVLAYLFLLRRLRQILPDESPDNSSERTR